jgi:hypothetical protein
MIEAVVFDMDGVLCRYRIERRLELLARFTGQRPEAMVWPRCRDVRPDDGVQSDSIGRPARPRLSAEPSA